ncbi:Na+/H+ antiporter subunit E [Marisediminicola senii]|uniref:Na+/H+ antiporter subunit E n=1 Tax=Marisediminicola senii TaxID=2711233 RepID=UPI0013EC5B0C|nr:Na+/H+ antiporter subunit E [Marisediminicola senii]
MSDGNGNGNGTVAVGSAVDAGDLHPSVPSDRRTYWEQAPLFVVLVILWMLLWGNISWLNLATGAVLAVVVMRFFYLPPIQLSGRTNPLWFVAFLGQFLFELTIASFQVAAQALLGRRDVKNSIIAVQLRTRSDIVLTLTAIAMSLMPGSYALDVDRRRSIIYFHALNTRDADGVQAVRDAALKTERMLVRAFGSSADLRSIR